MFVVVVLFVVCRSRCSLFGVCCSVFVFLAVARCGCLLLVVGCLLLGFVVELLLIAGCLLLLVRCLLLVF